MTRHPGAGAAGSASGRTTSVLLPDSVSTTHYIYEGASVIVKDPAGNSKTFGMDAFGNLGIAQETDPALGTVSTSYAYDVLNHLTTVYMPRGSAVQQRTFNYNPIANQVGAFLLSATNPENGTVSYTYDVFHRLASKTDAKNQQLTYQYDGYNRLTSLTWANAYGGAQVLRTYYYDTNPLNPTFSSYPLGRLTAVQYPAQGTIQMNDMYSYTQAGLPATKRLQVNQPVTYKDINNQTQHGTPLINLDALYSYNGEGGMTAVTYPSTVTGGNVTVAGPSYNYSYDSMYRLSGMTQGSSTIVSGVTYNAANQLLTIDYPGANESRGYNSLNQLITLSAGTENLTYNYPAGTNNGKISSMYNAVSGETITYTYDSLNRLLTASGSGWGDSYGFDSYGNLSSMTVTSGSAPSMSQAVNTANNQIVGYTYDANGNMTVGAGTPNVTYDVENRVSFTHGLYYYYDAQNRRTWSWSGSVDSLGNSNNYTVNFYAPGGQKLAAYQITPYTYTLNGNYVPYLQVTPSSTDMYFGSRRLAVMDQLGSAGTYYPWGENKGTTSPQNAWSFASYWRDSASQLDYANNRYYSNAYGRFMTPDPYQASGGPSSPQSWNRYAYTRGDPVNLIDPLGTSDCPGDSCGNDGNGSNNGGDSGDGNGGDGNYPGGCDPSDPTGQSCSTGIGGPTGTISSTPPTTLGEATQLETLEQQGLISGWSLTPTGVDLSFVPGAGAAIGAIACAADPVCDIAAIVVGGVATIYVAYKYLPSLVQSIENASQPFQDDPCYLKYLEDTQHCGAVYTDDEAYEECMEVAWLNYQRCKSGQQPIKWPFPGRPPGKPTGGRPHRNWPR